MAKTESLVTRVGTISQKGLFLVGSQTMSLDVGCGCGGCVHSPAVETLTPAPGSGGTGSQRALPQTPGLPGRRSAPPSAQAGPQLPRRTLSLLPELKRSSININHKQMVLFYNIN